MVHKSTQIFPQAEGVATLNGLTGEVTLAGGHAIAVTTDSGTDTITTAFNGGLDDLNDVDLFGVVTGDVLLKGPGSWINYPLGTITSGFVPYTGASANVNLGSNTLTAATVSTDTVIAENLYFNSVPFNSLICTSPSSGQLAAVTIGSNLSFAAGTLAVTGAALTKTDDANVTLTLGGGASSSVLSATSLTLGWTGTLAATRGGTGFGSYAVGDILYANTTTTLAKLADVATGNVLLSGGVGVAPSWGKVSASGAMTGVLPIANGGTNTDTQTAFGMCYYDGTKLTTSPYATMSFIAGDIDLLLTHPSVAGTTYEVLVTSSSSQYLMAYNTVSTFQGVCGTAATENYWTLSTKGLGLSVSAAALWFGSTSNDDLSFYRNNTERLRLTTTGIYVPDVAYLSAASPTINTMVSGTSLIQSSVRLISAYSGAASANSSYFLGSGNDGGLLQLFGAGGTIASPTALTTDSRMGGVFGRGYAATGYSNAVTAVTFHAETTFTDTSTPTYIAFATTASGATTRTEAMRITSSGNLLLGTTSTSARITLGGSPVMQTLIRNDAVLTASGTNANQYGFINYNNMTFISGSSNYATGHYADLKVNVPGGATVINATSIIAVAPTNLGAGSVTHAKAFQANAPTVGASSNIAAYLENVSIGSGFTNTTPPTNGALIQGNVAIATTDTSRRLVVAGVGATNDKLLYLRQTNDYGYSFNLDSSSSGRMYLYGVNAGAETSAIMTFDRTNTYVGIGTTGPTTKLNIKESGTNNAVVFIEPGTWAPGYYGEIRFGDTNHYIRGEFGAGINIYDVNRIALTGSNVGIGTTAPEEILHIAKSGSGTIGARILLDNTASPATNNACEIGFLTDSGASVAGYNANVKALQDGSGTGYTALTFGTYNGGGTPAERVRISPAGDVSIGIAASARAKLEVAGDIWTDWSDRFIGTVYQTGTAYKMGIGTTTGIRALDLIAMSADSSAIRFWTGATPSVNAYIDHVSNVVLGNQSALATNATDGFVYIRTCAGTPTGAPTAFTGHVAMLYDTTNNKLYCYNGAWKSVTLT